MTDGKRLSVEREIRIAARPEIVFEHFVDPDRLARWLGPAATVDAWPGGDLRVAIDGVHPVSGQFVELDPPRRLVFTWGWERPEYGVPPGGTRVEVDLTPDGGATLLRLRHLDIPGSTEGYGEGWTSYLERLAAAATDGDTEQSPATTSTSGRASTADT